MAIGLLGRLNTLAELHERDLVAVSERFDGLQLALDGARSDAISTIWEHNYALAESEIENLVYNMSQRTKARGIREKDKKYLWLHGLRFEQTFADVHTKDQKDVRVREFFDPLLVICGGDKRILLAIYTRMLNRFYPIAAENIYWRPVLRSVAFTPKRKSDTRTMTYTIVHQWGHIKKTT